MVENDIYNNKSTYDRFKANYKDLLSNRHSEIKGSFKSKYYAKNPINADHFKRLFPIFESKDISYIRRMKLINTLRVIVFATKKDLSKCKREDIDDIVAYMHTINKTIKTKSEFIQDIKYLWKLLFPERDDKGRILDKEFPYVVRHLSQKQDKSKEKKNHDILEPDELYKLVNAFGNDPRVQAYIMLCFEGLGRPQEMLYTKLKAVHLSDNYGKIDIDEHGKEGIKFIEVIDAYPYLSRWMNVHPLKDNPNAYLFINTGRRMRHQQLKPDTINKIIQTRCREIGINKKVTTYTLKRSGINIRRYRGDSDVEIQHVAGWTSTKRIKDYDYTEHDKTFRIQLAKRGLIKDEQYKEHMPTTKTCLFCNTINGFNDTMCSNCKRPLDREKILAEQRQHDEMLRKQLTNRDIYKLIQKAIKKELKKK